MQILPTFETRAYDSGVPGSQPRQVIPTDRIESEPRTCSEIGF